MGNGWELSREELRSKIGSVGLNKYVRGDGAENYLRSIIQRREIYDVFKPDVDYGIDLIALERASLAEETPRYFYFQVKSREVTETAAEGDSRPVCEFALCVAATTLNLMKGRRNYAIVTFLYRRETTAGGSDTASLPFLYFWLNGEDLTDIAEACGELREAEGHSRSPIGPYYEIPFRLVLPKDGAAGQSPYLMVKGKRVWYGGRQSDEPEQQGSRFHIAQFFRRAGKGEER